MRTRPVSISSKLTWMNLMVSGIVLVLAVLAFFFYDLISFRQNLIRNLETSAQIVGANSVSAMLFNDPESATATLDALRTSPDILGAVLATSKGSRFAEYRRQNSPDLLATLPAVSGMRDEVMPRGTRVLLAHPVVFQGKFSGTVYIAAELTEAPQRARHYLTIAVLIILICMLAALLISSNSRRMIALPVIALSETARRVSREKDYSVRAQAPRDNDEIAVLVDAFNEMLSQIQERDAALRLARDTLEKRVEERTEDLRTANRELEAFSYTVAHDLRGPLDSVQGMVFLLQTAGEQTSGTERAETLARLGDVTRSMALLIDDLLQLSRAGTAALQRVPVDLSMIARRIAEELQRSQPERKVEFMIANTLPVEADEGLMRIALDNLLRNAWKYTSHRQNACIEFGFRRIHGELVYFVRDDGAGFDPALRDRLFQPFHRLHNRAEFPGTGIGLATVQRILARHGGRIWAESKIDKGATFYFTLSAGHAAS